MQKTYSTSISGMTCGNCALTISKALEKKGATNVSANAASGEVSFTISEEHDVEKLYDTIDSLGYKVEREEDAIYSGLEDLLTQENAYCLIEWPQKAKGILQAPYLTVSIETKSEMERLMCVYLTA